MHWPDSSLALAGILVVLFILLTIVAAKTGLLRVLDRRLNREVRPPTQRGPDEETIAVIAAAAVMSLEGTVRVRRVRLFSGESGGAWTSVGRLNIMASHTLARRKP